MPKDIHQLQAFYDRLDELVEELIDLEFAAEMRRVRRALVD
jgi:hypothetical protein